MIWKRILAFLIDWNLSAIPTLLFTVYLKTTEPTGIMIFLAFLFILLYPVIFVLRDVLCGGRSVAKRIFKLHVIDLHTNTLPSKKKLMIRNLFFFVYPVEAILLIINKQTLGDMVTETTVICK
jgi:uncharacterized RDD family membrane protein YckC